MTDDFAPFQSPKLLIEGAEATIAEFQTACDRFIQNCTYDTIRYIEPSSGDKVVRLRLHHRAPPKLRLSAYRILNDLRNALDQAVCDAAVTLGRSNAKGVYFPCGKTPQDFVREIANKCKQVNTELVAFIQTLKPYYGGDDLLYILCKLAGPNKHQRVISVALHHTGLTLQTPSNAYIPHADLRPLPFNKWNSLRNELEFMRFGHGMEGRIDAAPVFRIVLGDGEPPLSGPAATVLEAMANNVENIVLSLERETARIQESLDDPLSMKSTY